MTDDEFETMIDTKRRTNAYFRDLDLKARLAESKPAKVARPKKTRTKRALARYPVPDARMPTLCAGSCGRLLRPPRTMIADWPETIKMATRGRCSACCKRPDQERRQKRPTHCAGCHRPMRGKTELRTSDTVRFAGRGLCTWCSKKQRKAAS